MGLYEWLDAHSLKFIDAVVLVNKGMLCHPRLKNISGVNFHIVNNGISLSLAPSAFTTPKLTTQPFNNLDKSIVEFCQSGFTIGSIGRLTSEKGFLYLVDAVRQARTSFGDIRLVIIGEGEDRKQIEKKIVEFNLENYVLLPGYKREARHYLKLFGAFVIPSITEGLPITLLEAMEAETPIIATRVGGIPDVLDDGAAGLLVKSSDSQDLSKAIICLRKDSHSALRRVLCASKIVKERYSSQAMADGYSAIYPSVMPNQL